MVAARGGRQQRVRRAGDGPLRRAGRRRRHLGGTDRGARAAAGPGPRRAGRPARAAHRRAPRVYGTARASASRPCTTRVPSGCSSPTSPTARACPSPSCPGRDRGSARGRCSTPASRSATRWTSGAPGGHPRACSAPACARWPTTRAVAAVALAVDLVEEYDGDDSYPRAVLDAAAATDVPVVVLTNLTSAVDQALGGPPADCRRPRARRDAQRAASPRPPDVARRARARPATRRVVDADRRQRWRARLAAGPLDAVESFALLRDYGIATVDAARVTSRDEALRGCGRSSASRSCSRPDAAAAHKTDVGGVLLGLHDADAVAAGVRRPVGAARPAVLVSATARRRGRAVRGGGRRPAARPGRRARRRRCPRRGAGRPRGGAAAARRRPGRPALDRLRVRQLLDGVRGGPAADLASVRSAVVAVATIALELGDQVRELDINPLVAGPGGAVAVDALVVAR